MKKVIVTIFLILFSSCEKDIGADLKVKNKSFKNKNTTIIENKLADLKDRMETIRVSKVKRKLDKLESYNFDRNLANLKSNINDALGYVKEDYTQKEKRILEKKYLKAKESWEFLLKNYRI